MSIANEINRISTNVEETLNAIEEMGGTVPEGATSNDMAAAARTIPVGAKIDDSAPAADKTYSSQHIEGIVTQLNQAIDDKLDASNLQNAVNDALTQAKESGLFDGEPGKDGKNGQDGAPGYTPQKGVDYFDGAPGEPGEDGMNASHSWNGTVLTVTSASGTSSADLKGPAGAAGTTPVKGTDYFTEAEVNQIAQMAAGMVEVPSGGGSIPFDNMELIFEQTFTEEAQYFFQAFDYSKYLAVLVYVTTPGSSNHRITLRNDAEYAVTGSGANKGNLFIVPFSKRRAFLTWGINYGSFVGSDVNLKGGIIQTNADFQGLKIYKDNKWNPDDSVVAYGVLR